MDELNKTPDTEPIATRPGSAQGKSNAPTSGQPSEPRRPSRSITSKRVVIPPDAKRAAKRGAPATPSAAEPTSIEPAAPALPRTELEPEQTPEPLSTSTHKAAEEQIVVSTDTAQISTADATPTKPTAGQEPDTRTLIPSIIDEPTPAPAEPTRGLSPSNLPYLPSTPGLQPVVETPAPSRRVLEFTLWGIAILLLVGAAFLVLPQIFPNLASNQQAVATEPPATAQVAAASPKAPSPTTTQLPTQAPTQPNVASATTAPLVIPTPPQNGEQLSLLTDGNLTGWIANGDSTVHYGDANLNAGTLQGKTYTSILQFNLRNLPADTKILFAALEFTGRDASNLGSTGEWQFDLVENPLRTDWANATPEQIQSAKSLGVLGKFQAADLGAGRLNRLLLDDAQMQLLQQQFKSGSAVLRIRGPQSGGDNLFTWESGVGGSAVNAPTLHLVVVPGKYVVVTNTPQPRNVLTAAAYVVRGTDAAKRLGTPTPFPPGVATATPGGEIVEIPFETAVSGNDATAIARSQLATAIAATTGTYTPTPKGAVIIFPTFTPVVISPNELATATPVPANANLVEIPIDYDKCNCQNRILLYSNRYGGKDTYPIMIDPDGTELGKLSGDFYYRLAAAREPYSPDRKRRLIYPTDSKGIQQIGIQDLETGDITFITHFPKGIAYDAAWAPDGSAIVFVSTEVDNADQIYLYDFGTGQIKTLIKTPGGQPWFKHPSWSPDSQQIVYWSSVSGNSQIWVMNRDGSNQHNISNNSFTEIDPVWVK
jgi:hypothetical protein